MLGSSLWALLGSIAVTLPRPAAQGYPHCIENDVVLRHGGANAIFVDLSTFATVGCWQNDCKHSDKFNAEDQGICARACMAIHECTHWTFGEQEGAMKCFLRKSDGAREQAEGWISGAKVCSPPELPEAFLALATATLPELQACDNGRNDACPDMAKAIRTWRFAIANLKIATDGVLDANTMQYVNQVAADTDAFASQINEETFPVVVANNREVFNALLGWLDSQPKASIDPNDASLPNPLRGRLCGITSCYDAA